MNTEDLIACLQQVVVMLALIPTEEIERHVNTGRGALEHADAIGCLIDPTAYRKASQDGSLQDAWVQQEIVEHLLKARQAIDKREAWVVEVARKRDERG